MKRFLWLLSTLVLCGLLSGCTGDPRGDAIQNVVDLMGTAAGDTGGITEEVKKAVKSHVDKKEPLDFEGAIEAAKKLRKTGEQLQAVKVSRVDQAGTATDDEKKEYAERFRARINDARARLQSAKNELNAELQKAEAIDADAKKKVEELRTKIREAEGPFETLARQQG